MMLTHSCVCISCGSDGHGRSEAGHSQWRPGADGQTTAAGAAGEDQHWPAGDATTATTTAEWSDSDQAASGGSSGHCSCWGAPGGAESGDKSTRTEAWPAWESDHSASVHFTGREQSREREEKSVTKILSLQALQPGQGIPTGTPGHLLVKTDTGQYQILRTTGGAAATPATAVSQQQQQQTTVVRQTAPPAASAAPPPIRLPTQPVARPPASASPALPTVSAPQASAAAGPGRDPGGMGQQMTPAVKCRNLLATSLRLAVHKPDPVAKNVRELIQVT